LKISTGTSPSNKTPQHVATSLTTLPMLNGKLEQGICRIG
jgi:hypothetical protein